MSGETVFGLEVHIAPWLPLVPHHTEQARRIVRHGMADVLKWLGEDVGPKPSDEAHAAVSDVKRMAYVSPAFYHTLRPSSLDGLQRVAYSELFRARRESRRTYQFEKAYLPGDAQTQALADAKTRIDRSQTFQAALDRRVRMIHERLEKVMLDWSFPDRRLP